MEFLPVCAFCTALILLPLSLGADPPGPHLGGPIEVAGVSFRSVGGPGGRWFCTSIEVAAQPAPENPTRFVSRVTVDLELAYEVGPIAHRRVECYRAKATAVALEQGRATFHFYLPPEIVERDRISGDLPLYFVSLSAAGAAMPTNGRHVGPGIRTPEALLQFRNRIAAAAGANEGVLINHAQAPFSPDQGGPASPSLIL